ncbi:MAG: hypothetical protein IJY96_03545 [Oscillospiraceae bacterium]|nr:hypothetical protein [Oscillospiraceae bacterium]
MAEKKGILGTLISVGAVAAVTAAGVVAYLKKDELKKVTEDIMSKVKPTDTEGVYTADLDEDGTPDVILADTTGDGQIDTVVMDNDGDGQMDEVALDTDGDGQIDTVTPILCDEEDFAE